MCRGLSLAFLFFWCVGAVYSGEAPTWLRGEWAANPYWNDRKVEKCVYDTTSPLAGKERTHRVHTFVMIDNVTTPSLRRATEPGETVQAMQILMVTDAKFEDGIPLNYSASTYALRSNLAQTLRTSLTFRDHEGEAAKIMQTVPKATLRQETNGSSATLALGDEGAMSLESVPLVLRAMDFSTTATFNVLPTLLSSKPTTTTALQLMAFKDGEERITVLAGTFDCIRVQVLTNDASRKMMTLWYEKAFPNVLVQKITGNGKRFELRRLTRKGDGPWQ